MYLAITVVLMTCMIMQVSAKKQFGSAKLAAIELLTAETVLDIHRWWKNEISGGECAKNFVKNSARSGGLGTGIYIGGKIAKHFFPFIPGSSIIAKIVGGYFGMQATDYLIESLFNNSPKDKVLEEAYEFFDLEENAASIYEINQSFYRLANQFELDTDNFQKLQFYMSVIKLSKGEIF